MPFTQCGRVREEKKIQIDIKMHAPPCRGGVSDSCHFSPEPPKTKCQLATNDTGGDDNDESRTSNQERLSPCFTSASFQSVLVCSNAVTFSIKQTKCSAYRSFILSDSKLIMNCTAPRFLTPHYGRLRQAVLAGVGEQRTCL